jgi:hypothetical protein
VAGEHGIGKRTPFDEYRQQSRDRQRQASFHARGNVVAGVAGHLRRID